MMTWHCHSFQAPHEVDFTGFSDSAAAFMHGMPVHERPELFGYSSGILCIIIAMMMLVVFNIKQYSRFFNALLHDLWSLRRRSTLFDEHTLNETRTLLALVVQVCVCEAILLTVSMPLRGVTVPQSDAVTVMGAFIGVTVGYYLLQLLAYRTIGYVFSDKDRAAQFVSGFNASQTLLGFFLLLPAMIALFYPSSVKELLFISVLLYFAARIIFIYKGFRIFYHNFSNLLYFILYLCSVEIIPVLLVLSGTFSLCRNIIS